MIKTIVSTTLPINERFAIRKNIIKNGKGNRRVCIVTGTHGDELEGQMVCYLVAKQLNEHLDLLDGTVRYIPHSILLASILYRGEYPISTST